MSRLKEIFSLRVVPIELAFPGANSGRHGKEGDTSKEEASPKALRSAARSSGTMSCGTRIPKPHYPCSYPNTIYILCTDQIYIYIY